MKNKLSQKQLSILIILLQLLTLNIFGQCGEGLLITLRTQSEVNSFIDNYCLEFEGTLHIIDDNDGQDNIVNLDSLLTIKKVDGVFQIRNNPFLASLKGLDSISYIGALRIINNNSIASLEGLDALNSVYGDLIISQNENLKNLNSLNSLTTMLSPFGYIEISDNEKLIDLSGLSSLSSLVNGLIITDNVALTSLNGLQHVSININSDTLVAKDLEIFNNTLLDYCHIESVCEALSSVDVTFEIHDNGMNCDSKDVISSNCITPIIEYEKLEIKIYPNPVIGQIIIDSPGIETILIFNSIGRLIRRLPLEKGINKFDFSQFQKGMYLLKTTSSRFYRVVKS